MKLAVESHVLDDNQSTFASSSSCASIDPECEMMDDMIPPSSQQEQPPQQDSDVSEDDDDEELEPGDEGGSTSELCLSNQIYVDSGNDKKVLYLLCIGLTDNSGIAPLFSFEQEPWSRLPKTSLRPRNIDYVAEIIRRASLFDISPPPRPSNWTRIQINEWLERNPVKEDADIGFLGNEVARLHDVLVRAQEQESVDAVNNTHGRAAAAGRNWRGLVPYLRIILCLTQDSVKSLYLTRADARSRQQLDARNSETR